MARALGPLALTMGEPAGIGGEITLRAWAARVDAGLPTFFAIDAPHRLKAIAASLKLDVPIATIASPRDAVAAFDKSLPVLPVGDMPPVEMAKPSPLTAAAVLQSIDMAVGFAQDGQVAAMVTNPIQKSALYEAGFAHQGHTDYIASLCPGAPVPIMMLACETLRVVPVTQHIPLARVAEALTTDAIVETGRITANALRHDFGITAPRLVVAGLNPHAGESGAMGDEEETIIAPAVAALKAEGVLAEGISVEGPLSPDTMFHEAARARYDAALCMYHDQALIPIKTIAFEDAVNVTLGLPLVRTSPDHGTALDIVGKGIASPAALIAALKLAQKIASRRAKP